MKTSEFRTDFENVVDQAIFLHPNESNPIHQEKVAVWFDGNYFTADIVNAEFEGPDYYLGDVLSYNHGFTME